MGANCTSKKTPKVIKIHDPVYFSKNWKANLSLKHGDRPKIVRSSDGNLVAFMNSKKGLLQTASVDNGRNWMEPVLVFASSTITRPIMNNNILIGALSEKRVSHGGQLFFHKKSGSNWNSDNPIRDTSWAEFSNPFFASDEKGNLYCIWNDERNGNSDIYFSSSSDGGISWSTNKRIDGDETGQEQKTNDLIVGLDGTLYAFWEDNRNPNTLFDIYFSRSNDGGTTWSTGQKINDDTTHTWQVSANATFSYPQNLYVIWMDYRDKGLNDDIISNIYFSRSLDGGAIWSKNIPISKAKYGHNWYGKITRGKDGTLHCLWVNSDDNLNFDLLYAYSSNGGDSWSDPARVNDDVERAGHSIGAAGYLGENLKRQKIVGFHDLRTGESNIYFSKIMSVQDHTRPRRKPMTKPGIFKPDTKIQYKVKKILFEDHFEVINDRWRPNSGTWIIMDNTYVGFGDKYPSSFFTKEFDGNYVFEGEFKLDPIEHRATYIYFHSTLKQGKIRGYIFENHFRQGVNLSYQKFGKKGQLSFSPYAFQNDQWYSFRIVIQNNIVNYYIDDMLILANDGIKEKGGQIGVGSFIATGYFKNIKITSIQ